MTLTDKRKGRVKHLSGGQKQRLAIGLALVNDPKVIFLDEPTTGLDPTARRTLWDIILKLKARGKTIVLSTHYMEEAHVLCDRICLMDQGKIVALDTPRNLVQSLQSDSAIEFRLQGLGETSEVDKAELQRELREVREVKSVDLRKDVFVLYTDKLQESLIDLIEKSAGGKWELADLQTRTATLEDVFITMTGRSLSEK